MTGLIALIIFLAIMVILREAGKKGRGRRRTARPRRRATPRIPVAETRTGTAEMTPVSAVYCGRTYFATPEDMTGLDYCVICKRLERRRELLFDPHSRTWIHGKCAANMTVTQSSRSGDSRKGSRR